MSDSDIAGTNDAADSFSSGDLSETEWEEMKDLFQSLRQERFGTLWDTLRASESVSRSVLRDGTNNSRTDEDSINDHQGDAFECNAGCCTNNSFSFVPTHILKQSQATLDVSFREETGVEDELHTVLDLRPGSPPARQDDPASSDSEGSLNKDTESIALEHAPENEADSANVLLSRRQLGTVREPISILDSSTSSDEDGIAGKTIHIMDSDQSSVEENAEEEEDEGQRVWLTNKCESPRLLTSLNKLDINADEADFSSEDSVESINKQAERDEDYDSADSSDNTWNGNLEEDNVQKRPWRDDVPKQVQYFVSSDEDEESLDAIPILIPKQTQQKTTTTNASFARFRERLATKLFEDFNKKAFDGKLKYMELSWSKRLTSTAGKTILSRRSGAYTAKIELSSKILDRESRLRSTLLHEMCHAAAWIFDKNANPPHGPFFKKWAKLAQKRMGIAVTTTHSYDIARYAWACQTIGCKTRVHRPTRTFKQDRFVCKLCGGKFVEVDIESGETTKPREKKMPSKYNLFVKTHSHEVRRALLATKGAGGTVTQAEVMTELGRLWKEQGASTI